MEQIGIWGIYAFTLIMGVTLTIQIAHIFTQEKVTALSTTWIVYFSAMFLSGVIYGTTSQNTPLLINNLMLSVTHLILVGAILRYRGFSTKEWIMAAALMFLLLCMIGSQHQDRWFIAFAPGGILAIGKQAWTIAAERRVGIVSPWLLGSYVLANIFWTLYALAGTEWTLRLISPSNLVACTVLFGTWLHYRRKTPVTV